VHRSPACKACFQRAEAIAEAAGATEVHCLHLFAAILEQPGALITRVVTEVGVNIAALHAAVEAALVSLKHRQAPGASTADKRDAGPDQVEQPQAVPATPYLDQYGYDITQEARAGKIDPIIGRKEEILALVRSLHKKTKNIPVLISEPGVSRIAVVKGLAIRIARGDVVASIRSKRIVELHMNELARATPSRSQLAQGLQQAIEEASHNPDIILFIDEMHTMVGTESAAGDLEIASLLKPALGKGNLRCIGATTVENYRRYMELDPFFERHCQAMWSMNQALMKCRRFWHKCVHGTRNTIWSRSLQRPWRQRSNSAPSICRTSISPKRLLTCWIRRVHGCVLARSPNWRPWPPQK
jgi:ATP-dependent Clp protease ATP-binding subunit ClpC